MRRMTRNARAVSRLGLRVHGIPLKPAKVFSGKAGNI